jgi:hypothetical protein
MNKALILLMTFFVLNTICEMNVYAVEKYNEKKMFSLKINKDFYKSGKAYYINDSESVYILDMGSKCVYVYNSLGKQLLTLKTDFECFEGENVDITTNEVGDVLIYTENLLKIYSKQGKLIKEIRRKIYPQKLLFSDSKIYSSATGDVIYELSKTNHGLRQKKYIKDFKVENANRDGKVSLRDTKENRNIELPTEISNSRNMNHNFKSINSIDNVGNLYVNYQSKSDKNQSLLVKFDKNGYLLAKFERMPLRINNDTETIYDGKIEDDSLSFYKWEKEE